MTSYERHCQLCQHRFDIEKLERTQLGLMCEKCAAKVFRDLTETAEKGRKMDKAVDDAYERNRW